MSYEIKNTGDKTGYVVASTGEDFILKSGESHVLDVVDGKSFTVSDASDEQIEMFAAQTPFVASVAESGEETTAAEADKSEGEKVGSDPEGEKEAA